MAPKIALVHEWFVTYAGSERVIEQILQVFPDADLFALFDFIPPKERGFLSNRKIGTSFLQKSPFISPQNYRNFLPLMPLAVEQLDLSGYDIVISNSHAVSKGVITSPDQLHIGYIHTPMRYAWDMQNDYLQKSGFGGLKSFVARLLLHYIRLWDVAAASRPDLLLANSGFIRRRVQKIYRREARVFYPPVDTETFTPDFANPKQDFYLAASRLVPYKRMELIVEAFTALPEKKLLVVGEGSEMERLRALATPNITLLGYQPLPALRDLMRRARAFVFAAKEDFGIMPLEAQACGTPVIALGQGGALDTIRPLGGDAPATGILFPEQTVFSLRAAILQFEAHQTAFSPQVCRENAERFSNRRFQQELRHIVAEAWENFGQGQSSLRVG